MRGLQQLRPPPPAGLASLPRLPGGYGTPRVAWNLRGPGTRNCQHCFDWEKAAAPHAGVPGAVPSTCLNCQQKKITIKSNVPAASGIVRCPALTRARGHGDQVERFEQEHLMYLQWLRLYVRLVSGIARSFENTVKTYCMPESTRFQRLNCHSCQIELCRTPCTQQAAAKFPKACRQLEAATVLRANACNTTTHVNTASVDISMVFDAEFRGAC